jgi:hypothetical protein
MPSRKWTWAPAKPCHVPELLKDQVSARAAELIDRFIKPGNLRPPPKRMNLNYLVDIYTKWRGRYFYFMAKYASPGPNRIAPFFDIGFARLEYAGGELFNLAYFRHIGQWWQIGSGLKLEEALGRIKEGGLLSP